jgi:hypothetical protein
VRITVVLLFREGDKIVIIFLNSSLLFQTTFLPFGIASSFYYPHANRKITIFSLSSLTILNFSILTLFFTQSKHTPKLKSHGATTERLKRTASVQEFPRLFKLTKQSGTSQDRISENRKTQNQKRSTCFYQINKQKSYQQMGQNNRQVNHWYKQTL